MLTGLSMPMPSFVLKLFKAVRKEWAGPDGAKHQAQIDRDLQVLRPLANRCRTARIYSEVNVHMQWADVSTVISVRKKHTRAHTHAPF